MQNPPNTESPRRQLLDKAMKVFQQIANGSLQLKKPRYHHPLEYDRAIAGDIAAELAHEDAKWRCYHCGDEFNVESAAREHFGESELFNDKPVCVEARSYTLEELVKTNRELWTSLLKEREEHEAHEFQLNCWEEVGRKLTGKTNANWHDFAADGAALYERERERRVLSDSFLSHLIDYFSKVAPKSIAEAFTAYDPMIITPEEYLRQLRKP